MLNVQGAVGAVAMAKLLAGRTDGYTIGLYVASMNALVASGRAAWKLADLAPIARLEKIPSFLFVKQDSPYKTFDDLEKAVKAKPDALKTAILGKGSLDDVTLTFMARKGFKTTIVPFTSPGQRYSSILGDHADILYEQAGDVHQFIDAKKMRPVLVFNETRLPEFPDVACSREKGFEDLPAGISRRHRQGGHAGAGHQGLVGRLRRHHQDAHNEGFRQAATAGQRQLYAGRRIQDVSGGRNRQPDEIFQRIQHSLIACGQARLAVQGRAR